MANQPIKVLTLGNIHAIEMQSIVGSLAQHTIVGDVEHADTVHDAIANVTDRNWFPDLVIVVQQWPDEFTAADVRRLFALLPLARWICCFGIWCESDGRNRTIWPLSVRISARTAEARIRRELDVLRGAQPALPLTASRDEIFTFDGSGKLHGRHSLGRPLSGSHPFEKRPGLPILVTSPDGELRRWLQDLLRSSGFDAVSEPPRQHLAAVVWDVDPWRREVADEMRDFCDQNRQSAVVALMSFAHAEDAQAVKACGATAVVAKLTPQTDLLEAIHAAISQSPDHNESSGWRRQMVSG